MGSLRDQFLGFPWIPSFVASFLASLFLLVIRKPVYLPEFLKKTVQLVIQYGIVAIAIGGLVAGCLSLYYNHQQKTRWNRFERELEEKSENEEDRSDVTKSSTELLTEWINKVDDLSWISEDGEVTITAKDLKDAQKIILYLIGVRYAFELDLIDSPEVGTGKIAKKANIPRMTVRGWYLPLDDVIEKRHLEIWERFAEEEEGFFDQYQLKMENVDKAFHYVTGEEDLPEPFHLMDEIPQ